MIVILACLATLILLWIWKIDLQIRKEWNCINLIYKTVERDMYSGQYYEVYKSIMIFKLKK